MKNNRTNRKKVNLFTEGGSKSQGMSQGMQGGLSAMGSSVLGAIPNIYGEQTLAEKAVYGDTTQDPIARLMGDISGSNVRKAQKEINSQATNTAMGLSGIVSNDDLMNNWENITFQNDLEDPSAIATIGDNLMASAQGANQGFSAGGPWGALIGGIIGGVTNLGSLFGRNKRKRKIQTAIDKANALKLNAYTNQASNLKNQDDFNMLANYSAYGGSLQNKYKEDPFNPYNLPIYKDGGTLNTNGATFRQPGNLTIIKNGGTHNTNPIGGVPMGVDNQGIPNLVEEGEVIYNDYVFSNRLELPKEFKNKYKIKGNTFAEAAKELQKESEERPNDPISKKGLEDSMSKLTETQETLKQEMQVNKAKKQFNKMSPEEQLGIMDAAQASSIMAYGGKVNKFDGKSNPTGFMNIYPYPYDTTFDKSILDWKYSHPLWKDQVNLGLGDNNSIYLQRVNSGDVGDNVFTSEHNDFLRDTLLKDKRYGAAHANLPSAPLNEFVGSTKNSAISFYDPSINNIEIDPKVSNNSPVSRTQPVVPQEDKSKFKWDNEYLRYSPVVSAGIMALTDGLGLTNKPDYSNSDLIRKAANSVTNVEFNPIGNYLTYNPLDRDYYINKLNAQAGATRRAIENQANGNRAAATAGILAADYNAQNQLGNLARQAEEYNLNQRMQVEQFNRGTNQFNSQMNLQADSINQGNNRARMQALIQEAQMREGINNLASQARAANLNNFIDNLGALGDDAVQNRWFNTYMANSGATLTDSEVKKLKYKNAKAQGIPEERLRRLFPNEYK